VRDLEAARRYVEQGAMASHAESGLGVYRLEAAAGEAVGICGLFQRGWLPDPDVGFALLPAGRGRGYALESTAAVLALGFELLGLPRIGAITVAGNLASIRVLERAGLRFEGFVQPEGEAGPLRLFLKDRP
jgi:RimJ/RimL family protein N-acetyltransferase